MTANWTKTDTNRGDLKFTIPASEIQKELDRTFNRIKGNINLKGFRKGHVTRQAFNKMYGEEALYEDALNALLPTYLDQAIKEADVDSVTRPEIKVESMEKNSDWVIVAQIITKPEVKLGDYKHIEIEKINREVSSEDVDNRLASLQNEQAELVITEEAAQNNDTVVIDFEGFKDDEPFEGGKGDNYPLELGSGSFIPGFEEQLVGTKSGDEVEVNVTFPEDYHASDLAGQPVVFKVKVHEVKRKEVPELDDEFAKDVDDEVNSLDGLKEKVLKELQEQRQKSAEEEYRSAVLQKLVDESEIVDLPQEMIDEEARRSADNFLNQMTSQGIKPEMYYQLTGTKEEDLIKQFEEESAQRVRMSLILEQVAKEENIEPTTEEIDSEIKRLAKEYNMEEAQVRRSLPNDIIKQDLQLQKAVDLVTESAKEV